MKIGQWWGGALLLVGAAAASRAVEVAAVSSRASPEYIRHRLPNGSFEPESYVFGPGGYMKGDVNDPTIDRMAFVDVARVLAVPLKDRGYVPGRELSKIKFLIMVYWGTTSTPGNTSSSVAYQNLSAANSVLSFAVHDLGHQATGGAAAASSQADLAAANSAVDSAFAMVQAENVRRDHKNVRNAALLGYDSWWTQTAGLPGLLMNTRQEVVEELEQDRYFVILMAYDFQHLRQTKKAKLVWETRFSVDARRNAFNEDLAAMARQASQYFGRDSKGLVHQALPEVRVEVGALKVVPDRKP